MNSEQSDKESGKSNAQDAVRLDVSIVEQVQVIESIRLTITADFAPRWFEDALREANQPGFDARRREILFAVCCTESYLFEWVRDEVLERNDTEVQRYLPDLHKEGIKKRWKKIPKKLKEDKPTKVPNVPDYRPGTTGGDIWQRFLQLVDFRDGLVHAKASRFETANQKEEEKPVPPLADLDKMPPGDPTKVVVDLIELLHQSVGTPPPGWLKRP